MLLHGVFRIGMIGEPMPAQIGRNDTVFFGKGRQLSFPLQGMPAKAVKEYDRMLGITRSRINDAQADVWRNRDRNFGAVEIEVEKRHFMRL